eukprot:g5929.t1
MSDTFLFQGDERDPALAEGETYVRVAVERGIDSGDAGLTYRAGAVCVGDRVEVPLGRGDTKTGGFVIEVGGPDLLGRIDPRKIKRILGVSGSRLPGALVELARWMSGYYVCPLGMVLATMMPAAVKAGTGRRTRVMVEPAGELAGLVERVKAGEAEGLKATKGVVAACEALEAFAPGRFPIDAKDLARELGASNAGPVNKLVSAGVLREVEVRVVRAPEAFWDERRVEAPRARPELTEDQSRCVEGISGGLDAFGVHLLRGVTGSGKTEVYLRVIERVLAAGKSAIVLTPEIALTPQTAGRFIERFSAEGVAVLHSGLSASARHKQWAAAAAGEARVVVGARSAVYAPLADLGLIVVDEEHDGSYKQDQLPRYHARDAAIKRAQIEGVPVVLGSATPSLESWHNAVQGRFTLWEMPQRVGGGRLPRVEIVDLGRERRARQKLEGRAPHVLESIGPTLERAIGETIGDDGQVILLLNRRGYAGYIACPDSRCGYRLECDQCDACMVVHRSMGGRRSGSQRGYVRCHHCLSEQLRPETCPACGKRLIDLSVGTQRVEEELESRFGATLGLRLGETMLRVDSDSMRSARDYFDTLGRFSSGEIRLLLGTQMIAKGLDYPNVRLVGVINADTGLHMPDFRASERTFQLVSQVSGRAGRGSQAGRVIVQSFAPEEPALTLAARHDFRGFARGELAIRQAGRLPPFWRMARIISRDESPDRAQERIDAIEGALSELGEPRLVLEGPAPCPISRVAGRRRIALDLLSPDPRVIQRAMSTVRATGLLTSDAHLGVDVDPGADVLVTDLEPEQRLHESVRQLDDLVRTRRVSLRLGGHNVSDFTTCDVVVVNPAAPTPWENRFVRAARAGGARVTSEIALVCERLPARERVIGITGSAGKSTCAGMIAHAMNRLGERAVLGGNIGGSLLGELERIDACAWVVLELSSAMLHWLGQEERVWAPGIAVVTNLQANHLDWHGTEEHYEQSKMLILKHQRPGDRCVLGPGLDAGRWRAAPGCECVEVDADERVGGMVLPGRHNMINACVSARAIACALGADRLEDARRGVAGYAGLPHRLRLVSETGGVLAYDDSKSTTPGATVLAIEAVGETLERGRGGIHLIAGGYDKGADLSAIAGAAGSLGGLYTIGATGRALAERSGDAGRYCETLGRAVQRAMGAAKAGDAVLLSPGWDAVIAVGAALVLGACGGARESGADVHSRGTPPPAAVPAPTPDTGAPANPRREAEPEAASMREVFAHVRVDAARRVVEFDGIVPIDCHHEDTPDVYLEVIACTKGTREHEALVMTEARPSHVHAALLLIGLTPGAPGAPAGRGEGAIEPSGDAVRVEIVYTDGCTTRTGLGC